MDTRQPQNRIDSQVFISLVQNFADSIKESPLLVLMSLGTPPYHAVRTLKNPKGISISRTLAQKIYFLNEQHFQERLRREISSIEARRLIRKLRKAQVSIEVICSSAKISLAEYWQLDNGNARYCSLEVYLRLLELTLVLRPQPVSNNVLRLPAKTS